MDLRLNGRVAIVTGASRGIGRAIAQTLAAEGMKLSLAAPQAVVDVTMKKFGAIDVLVNNAGATKRGDFFELTDADWADGFALKFFGAMRLSRAAWKHLQASKGTIVNIIGVGGRTGNADFTIGGSVNAAERLFTKAMADRGVRDGVRVNAINPGFIKTERLTVRVKSFSEENKVPLDQAEAQLAKASGVARFGEPSEIAAAVAFLASPVCGYCHGALLDIDGGQTRTL